MSNQLDQRIRRLVVEVVDTSPPPPRLDELELPAPQRRPTRRIVVVAVAALTVVALAFGAAWLVRDEPPERFQPRRGGAGVVTIPLRDVPQGVSPRTRVGVPLFLVRHGQTVTTFDADDRVHPHRSLWWCVEEKVFESWSGDVFDGDGHRVTAGSNGLDRYPTIVRGGVVWIDLGTPITDERPPSESSFDAAIPCKRKVVSGQQIDIRALTNLQYDARELSVAAGIKTFRFTSSGGTHTLELTRLQQPVFTILSTGRPAFQRIVLDPGIYTIACTIPGHRDAGEEATIVVTP